MKNTNKLIIASLTMALCLCCMGGLYIISNADFTNPDISLTMDIQDISKPQWILFNDSYSGGTEVRIDDGTTYFTQDKRQDGNISHQFTTPGRHKVRIYSNGNRSLLVMTNNQSIVKFIQNKIGLNTHFMDCTNLTTAIVKPSAGQFNVDRPQWFYNCQSLKDVSLPSLVGFPTYRIKVFGYCISLEELNLPMATNLLSNTFEGCTSLKTFIATNVVSVGEQPFKFCNALETVVLPKLKEVPTWTFDKKANLRHLDLSGAEILSGSTMRECFSLTELSLPNATNIGYATFADTPLTRLELPKIDKATVQQNAWDFWRIRNPGCVIVCKDGEEYIVTQP